MTPRGTMQDYVNAAVRARQPNGQCLNEEQVVAFYTGQLNTGEEDAVREHLAECPACVSLARDARQFVQAMNEPVITETVGTPAPPVEAAPRRAPASPVGPAWHIRHRHQLFLLAAVLVVTIGGLLLLGRGWRVQAPSDEYVETPPAPASPAPQPPPRENPWRTLEIAQATYTPPSSLDGDLVWRDEGDSTPKNSQPSPFAQVMRSYQRDDFAAAEQELARFLQQYPRHGEAHFYRGVSLLKLNKTSLAIGPLQSGVKYGRGRVRGEAHWYLALAHLKTGDFDSAVKEFDNVIRTYAPRRAEAERLQQQVQKFLGSKS